jgi:hypothetical protein
LHSGPRQHPQGLGSDAHLPWTTGTPRHSRLRGDLATAIYGGRELEQWEIEVTGAGRIFYPLDKDKHAVRITRAETGHPKVTE